MGWAVGYDTNWQRDIGYGVPATCDHPGCGKRIDRGLAFVCGMRPDSDGGCHLYFCSEHQINGYGQLCERCEAGEPPFDPTPDVPEWIAHKLTDDSWAEWRSDHPDEVARLRTCPGHDVAESEAK